MSAALCTYSCGGSHGIGQTRTTFPLTMSRPIEPKYTSGKPCLGSDQGWIATQFKYATSNLLAGASGRG